MQHYQLFHGSSGCGNQRIIKSNTITNAERKFLLDYWTSVFNNICEFSMLETKQLYKCTLKEDYVLTLSVIINAFGRLGFAFYSENISLSLLKGLSKIDWLRINNEWVGRIFNEHGRIIGKEDSIIKITNLLKRKLGISLTKEEMVKENEIR